MHSLFMEGEAHDRLHRICAELGLSPPLLKAFVHLGTLADDGGLRMSDLAETWGCDASYVTTLADGLQERGLAERRPHLTDRRVKTIVLPPEGRAQGQAARELRVGRRRPERAAAVRRQPLSACAWLRPTEQRQLRDLLRKLVAADP